MKPTNIIIHHSLTKDSGTVSWSAIRRYHVETLHWRDIGYHYGIELVGERYEILVGRLMNEAGAHCYQQGMNTKSIGVCIVGNFDEAPPSQELWDLTVRFVKSLCVTLDIHPLRVFGHREFAGYKSCPGTQWDMEKFRQEVAA